MNFTICFKKLGLFFHKKKQPKISLLIPFSSKNPERRAAFKWLLKYWKSELPDAEIVIGKSRSKVFCKNEALNRAARKSKGRVLAILDADAYIRGHVIERAADKILAELDNHLWLVPYRRLYRLNKTTTEEILHSNPTHPIRLCDPLYSGFVENTERTINYGYQYGAMLMMFPREAYDILGGFNENFRGWGGEDIALVHSLDTLYGKYKSVNTAIYHLWHPNIGETHTTRKWESQDKPNVNGKLSVKYYQAARSISKMRKLIDEGHKHKI